LVLPLIVSSLVTGQTGNSKTPPKRSNPSG
ncbi:unnamed protein product, partial [Tetraodon nigroviridis]